MPLPETAAIAPWSLSTIKGYLNLPTSEQDTLIVMVANRTAAEFERYTGRQFVARAVTETWLGDEARAHMLKVAPVTAFASLTEDGQTVDPASYVVDLAMGVARRIDGAVFMEDFEYVASYTAGYGTKDSQESFGDAMDVYEAGLEHIKAILDEKRTGAQAATTVSVGPMSMILKTGKGYHIRDVLDRLRDCRG